MRLAATVLSQDEVIRRLKRLAQRQNPGWITIVTRAQHDCQQMYMKFLEGIPTTRRNMEAELDISKRRWQWARALARLADVHDGIEFKMDLQARDFINKLNRAAEQAENDPETLRRYRPA